MAKSQIIIDFVNRKCDLEITLKRLLLIATDLKNYELIKWVKNELYGYENDDKIPDYRKLKGTYRMSYIGSF